MHQMGFLLWLSHRSTVQYSTVQYHTVQYITYSTVQYNNILTAWEREKILPPTLCSHWSRMQKHDQILLCYSLKSDLEICEGVCLWIFFNRRDRGEGGALGE